MKKKILSMLLVVACVGVMVSPAYCDSQVIYTESAKERAERRKSGEAQSPVIYSARKEGQSATVDIDGINASNALNNMADYPAPIGAQTTRVTVCGQKIPTPIVIESPHMFINDVYGNIGIAYVDEKLNIPVNAVGGFYVVQQVNPVTKVVEWKKYCVDNSGYILFGWVVEQDGTRYYLSEDLATIGQVVTGAKVFQNGKTYYFDEDGILQNIE